jgi:hypothetical protein
MKNTAEPLPRSNRPYRLLILAFLTILCTPNRTWAQPCDPWCANSDTFNRTITPTIPEQGKYWVARSGGFYLINLWVNGLPWFGTIAPSFMSYSGDPSLQYFDQRMVMVVRAADQRIYANTYTNLNDGLGPRWTGWAADLTKLFGPHSPGIASKIPVGQTGILLVAAKDGNGGTWHIRSTAIANGFADGWRYLGCCAPPNVPTLACGDPSQLRLGGTGNDGRCYRRVSTDGLNWPPPDQVISPCP